MQTSACPVVICTTIEMIIYLDRHTQTITLLSRTIYLIRSLFLLFLSPLPLVTFCSSCSPNTGLQPPRSPSRSDLDLRPSSHGQVIDCVTTPWGPWSDCSRTCGKGHKTRMREIKIYPENGGRECPNKLMQRRRCKENPPCREYSKLNYYSWIHCTLKADAFFHSSRFFPCNRLFSLSLSPFLLYPCACVTHWTITLASVCILCHSLFMSHSFSLFLSSLLHPRVALTAMHH